MMKVETSRVRWSNLLVFMALIVFTVVCRQASHSNPLQVSQLKTDAASLSGQCACMHPVTIVSAYYPLNTSKHSLGEYNEWMESFFPYVSAPIVLYSPPGAALDYILELRGDLPMTVKVRSLIGCRCKHSGFKFTAFITFQINALSFKSCGRYLSSSLIAWNLRIGNTT